MSGEIETCFRKMGVRVKVSVTDRFPFQIDLQRDRGGEYFLIRHRESVELAVTDITPWNRHLLLTATRTDADGESVRGPAESAFLCGRDEQHWFVAAIPESAQARTVQDARDALKPKAVWDSIREHGVPDGQYDGRRNNAFLRQGEWFFLPRPWLEVDEADVHHDEPIRRGVGKPHRCQSLHRVGGTRVYVREDYPNGLTRAEYRALSEAQRRLGSWRKMVREARVYVRGSVEHPDHKAIWLPYWHEVVMNTETQARAMRDVAFLD